MLKTLREWGTTFERQLTVVLGAIALTALLLNFDFHFLEANLYDLRVSRGIQKKGNQDIVLITIDDATAKEFNEFAPLPLDFHVKFIETLEQARPRAVGYLVDMNYVNQVNPEFLQKGLGNRFIEAVKKMTEQGILFLFGTSFDVTGEVLPPAPLDSLPHAIGVIHKDGNVFSEDKITRRALLTVYDRPAFHLELARNLGLIAPGDLPPGSFHVSEVDGTYFFFRYHESTVLCPEKNPGSCGTPYPRISFADFMTGRADRNQVKDKIVLVGTLSSDDSGDFALTPFSKTPFSNPKLFVHANILNSVLDKDGIIRVPSFFNGLVTFGVTLFVLAWILNATPLYGLFATLSLALIFILVSQLLFQVKGLWLRESQPLVAIFVTYYLAVPYRLIREYKTRWEYQRKNEILTQVEELKSNFLNLVTHDLKTPVARIQGLAEVLLKRTADRIADSERQNLRQIIASTEELNRFITSILELSKVESNHVQIRPESKDVNLLLEKSVETLSSAANSRRIRITQNLEPLFPVKLDASLISKVFNNLIDNAIKYSKDDSEIKIESKEEGDWIVISISDEGIGMSSDEQENLFTRFYRAKNDATIAIPGTGLGLYLTKYFIEAHRGRVEVSSVKNEGSIFKIYLPIKENSKCLEYS